VPFRCVCALCPCSVNDDEDRDDYRMQDI
jgi:hypothetical protein